MRLNLYLIFVFVYEEKNLFAVAAQCCGMILSIDFYYSFNYFYGTTFCYCNVEIYVFPN